MMSDIRTLQPAAVWQWFADICAIPHPSHHEQALRDFILQRATEKGLTAERDTVGNIRLCKPASPGLEHAPAVALQAHIDMVPQKGEGSSHCFETDPIRTHIEEGWLYADNTTLGADNGIGAAMALAVAFADDIPHPPLNIILTVEEETGMGGALALDPDWLDVPYLINLDSEDAGSLFIGCAGGRDVHLHVPAAFQAAQGQAVSVRVSGLKGGHSGIDINKGRGNAILMLAQLLAATELPFSLASLQGGSLRNVLPRSAEAVVVYANGSALALQLLAAAQRMEEEMAAAETGLEIELLPAATPALALNPADSRRVIDTCINLPNGVLRMSDHFPGVVETSISLGHAELKVDGLHLLSLMRSLAESPKDAVGERLAALARLSGGQLTLDNDYPGWQPDPASALLARAQEVLHRFYGRPARIEIMHAGLECGILKSKAPHTDMISFGPDIRAAHSPKECVHIDSVGECWQILLTLLGSSLPQNNTVQAS
ncbi:dipeptidase D [Neisseria sp. HSC-16F19]|nr:beta-Ala-His dipeptidase [Neisseria sp. HSC-16F19]MCP2039819.1 dipeptidase D [Neisseria sp. HSC-16F19]